MTNDYDTMKAILLLLASLPMVRAMAQSSENDSIRQRDMNEVTVKAEKRDIHSHDGMLRVDLPHIVKTSRSATYWRLSPICRGWWTTGAT